MTEEKAKSLHFTSGLVVGTAIAAAATFLYKTKKGSKVKKILDGYYHEAKNHIDELIKDVKKQSQKTSLPEAVEQVANKEIRVVKKKIKTIKKNVFRKSGQPLVK